MEAHNHFTCIAYNTVDFLIQSKYVVFGIYLDVKKDVHSIIFNKETLPHIHIGTILEKVFQCQTAENCSVVLVMKIQDFARDVRQTVEAYTGTKFPASGNFALSVNSAISSSQIDLSSLRLLPRGIRAVQSSCGVSAIGFRQDSKNKKIIRKQILISPDNLLRKFFSSGLINKKQGVKNESHTS